MQRIFNKDGFNWWLGVVENRQDPEKLGRCKVRIFGYHTDSKELLPTKDLPWCIPIQPITSAATSGLGSSPLGPVEGTWVIGFFLDGEDMQQPAMFGTISTKAAKQAFTQDNAAEKPRDGIVNPQEDTVRSSNDTPVRDSAGNPVRTSSATTPVTDEAGSPIRTGVPAVPGWELGQTSKKYESGSGGPGTINDYKGAAAGDLGGASYGTYQLASYLPAVMKSGKARPSPKGSPVEQFCGSCKFKDKFAGLIPATPEFDSKWKELSSSQSKEFAQEQHDYIQRKYYNTMISNLQRTGLDLTKYGPGVQDLVWSTAVQLGPAKTSIFTTPLKGKSELTDKDIVTLVSDYKINNVEEFFKSSSSDIRAGVAKRWQSEKAELLKLIK